MKTRKQLPAFGYLSNFQIDTARLIEHLQNNNLLDWEHYVDVKASTDGAFTPFIKANQWTLDNFFKEIDAPSLESEKFRQIQLPDCVQFVVDLKEAKGSSIFATIDRDFAEQKFIGSEIYLTPFIGESIMYRTVIFSFLDIVSINSL